MFPGQVSAIIGGTGSGKTTLVNLVPRLFDATAGSVLVDNVDVRDLDPAVLSGLIGLVPQRPYLFSGTVASNLRYGKPDATDAELWRALEIAQGRDFVAQMQGGLDAAIHDQFVDQCFEAVVQRGGKHWRTSPGSTPASGLFRPWEHGASSPSPRPRGRRY